MDHRIYLNNKDFELFRDSRYGWVVAENGLFLIKDNSVLRAVVLIKPAEIGLLPLEERIELKSHIKISFDQIFQAVQFFRWAYYKRKCEAFLDITYDEKLNSVGFFCPNQRNTRGSVHAEEDPEFPAHLLKIGDMHSHPCDAFHSNGDKEDELYSDGLHIVVGRLDDSVPSFAATLVVKGRRKPLDPREVIEWGFDFNKDWMRKINRQ